MIETKKIYLDCAATTPVDPEVFEAMEPYFNKIYGNPSSIHSFGREARSALDKARQEAASFFNCESEEIIFTSGGTEADNLAIMGCVFGSKAEKPHVITSKIEHHAVLSTVEHLERKGVIEASFLGVDEFGEVSVKDLEKAIKPNTVLISVMYANNEIGTIQPIKEIGRLVREINKQRGEKQRLYFHTDAVQGVGYLEADIKALGVDLLSMSGHKIYGPKGIGLLFIKSGTEIVPILHGGGQELKKRPGTENVAGIVGLAAAINKIKSQKSKARMTEDLRDYLIGEILAKIPDTILTGHPKKRLPNIASFCFKGVEGESILINLDLAGIAASSGSACTSGALEPSHVLSACGIEPRLAHGNIRFSLGKFTTKEDIDRVIEVLPPIIEKLRRISSIH